MEDSPSDEMRDPDTLETEQNSSDDDFAEGTFDEFS